MTAREELQAYVEQISEPEATMWLEAIRTANVALIRALLAPTDDEAETAEEHEDVAQAWEEYRRGDGIPHAELRRQLGL